MRGKTALRLGILGFSAVLAGIAWAAMRLDVDTTYTVTLGRNVILADTPFVRIFDAHQELRVTTDTADDSADIDILLRRGQPLDQSTVGALFDSATAVADGPGGDMELVLTRDGRPRLTTGKWYLQLINRSGPETEVQFRAEVSRDSGGGGSAPGTAKVNPLPGMWFNPARDGHGLDIQIAGEQLFATWFTYDETGLPVWYLASGPFDGAKWEAELLKFTSLGTKADGKLETASASVGTASLEFLDSRNAQLSYEIEGTAGAEPITPLIVADTPPVENLTGHYFSRNDPGWGYTLNTQGRQVFAVLYYYDNRGRPRWVLGSMERPFVAKGAKNEFEMEVFQFHGGPAPGGPNTAPDSNLAGTINVSDSRIKTSVRTDKPLAQWIRDRAAEALSDDPPPYVFGQIQGPAFLATNSSAAYAAKVDTDAPVSELSYTWNRFGATISSGIDTGPSTVLRTGSQTGLATLQLNVKHEPSGVSAFVTRNVSVQQSTGVFSAAIQGDPRPAGGLPSVYTAQVFGGQPPYRYTWTRSLGASFDGGSSITILTRLPDDAKEETLTVDVTDNLGDTATAALTIAPRPFERPELRVLGPAVVGQAQPATFFADPVVPGSEILFRWDVGGSRDLHGRVIEEGCGSGDTSCTVRWNAGSHRVTVFMSIPRGPGTVRASKQVTVDQGLITATFASRPLRLDVDETGTFLIDVQGGSPPFDVIIDFDGDGLGDGFTTRSRQITRTHAYDRAGDYAVAARVTDSNLQSSTIGGLVQVGGDNGGEPPANGLAVNITSPSGLDYCSSNTLRAEIENGEPPFSYVWDFGDGNVMTGNTSNRTINVNHRFPEDAEKTYTIIVEVEDDLGDVAEDRQTVSHDGPDPERIGVQLRNNGVDNIHIYNKDRLAPIFYFSGDTRITRGSSRTEAVEIPACDQSLSVLWGAGRQDIERATTTCRYQRGEPGGSVTYSESGFNVNPALRCGL